MVPEGRETTETFLIMHREEIFTAFGGHLWPDEEEAREEEAHEGQDERLRHGREVAGGWSTVLETEHRGRALNYAYLYRK